MKTENQVVFIVEECIPYCGDTQTIFSTREKAEAYIAASKGACVQAVYRIVEMDVH